MLARKKNKQPKTLKIARNQNFVHAGSLRMNSCFFVFFFVKLRKLLEKDQFILFFLYDSFFFPRFFEQKFRYTVCASVPPRSSDLKKIRITYYPRLLTTEWMLWKEKVSIATTD